MTYNYLPIIAAAIFLTACSPGETSQQKVIQSSTSRPVLPEASGASQQADVKIVAKAYGVTEDRANNVAERAAAMSGGNANKQDMLDALKAARGE